jgi:carotenoid cleavage dioxygenase-like enzyme
MSGKLILFQIAANGNLQRSKILDAPNFGIIYDFTITDKSVIFLIPPSRYGQDHAAGARSFLAMHSGHLDQAVDILVIDKSTLGIP